MFMRASASRFLWFRLYTRGAGPPLMEVKLARSRRFMLVRCGGIAMSHWKFLTAVSLSLVAFPIAAAAQSDLVPAARSANGIKFVSGGVGKAESQAMFK